MNFSVLLIKIKTVIKKVLRIVNIPVTFLESKMLLKKEPSNFKYNFGVVAIVKDEESYIREWALYYKSVGVSVIYLYDNGSTDKTKEEVQDLIDLGFIQYTFYPGIAKQYSAYEDAIRKHKNDVKYMAFLDADEFLICNSSDDLFTIVDTLLSKDSHYAGLAVNWRMYGSSGHIQPPKGLVLDNYIYRAAENGKGNACIKSIINPRKVIGYRDAHYPKYGFGYFAINELSEPVTGAYNWSEFGKPMQKLRINHYYTKSWEEWLKRRSRRVADRHSSHVRTYEQLRSDFQDYDSCSVLKDLIGVEYADRFRALMNREIKND